MYARRRRLGLTLLEVIVIVFAVVISIGLFLPSIESRGPTNSTSCRNNLKQLGLAFQNYHDTFGCLPSIDDRTQGMPNGHGLSGFAALLPFMEERGVYQSVNFALGVDAAQNSTAKGTKIRSYLCPTDESGWRANPSATCYLLCAGVGPFLVAADNAKGQGRGCFALGPPTKLDDVKDGTAQTVAIFETTVGVESPISPQRQYVGGLTRSLDCSDDFGLADFRAGRNLLTDRGSSWMDGRYLQTLGFMRLAPNSSTPDAAFADFSGGISGPRSMHPKGSHVCFVDGSVRSLSQAVDPKIVQAYGTIDGGERIQLEE